MRPHYLSIGFGWVIGIVVGAFAAGVFGSDSRGYERGRAKVVERLRHQTAMWSHYAIPETSCELFMEGLIFDLPESDMENCGYWARHALARCTE